jgi:dihydrofolate reductase
MGKVVVDISMSLDGFVAGPDPSMEDPLGKGGERLHDWAVKLESFKRIHGHEGGEGGTDSDVLAEAFANTGATIMGRRMFSGGFGTGPWEDDPNPHGWWGDEPPFRVPVFVLTHHPRQTVEMRGGTSFTFVTDGFESALEDARVAAEGKDISVAGGAEAIQEALAVGCLDEIQVHVVPLLLGGGTPLFGDGRLKQLEPTRVIDSPAVTHVKYRVLS